MSRLQRFQAGIGGRKTLLVKIKIYQVNMERDENRVAFMAYESLAKFQGNPDVDSRIYDKVFEGEVNCFTLEKLYEIFNCEHLAGYKGRSMSVSDVVEIVDGTTGKSYFNFCDSFGFPNPKRRTYRRKQRKPVCPKRRSSDFWCVAMSRRNARTKSSTMLCASSPLSATISL